MKEEFEVKAGRNWRWIRQSFSDKKGLSINLSRKLSNKLQFKKDDKIKVIFIDEEIKDTGNLIIEVKADWSFFGQEFFGDGLDVIISRDLAKKLKIKRGTIFNVVLNKME